MNKVVVFGSINTDITVQVSVFPSSGQTITGNNLFISKGGKGANQAVALSRLGVNVKMFACVGNDMYGTEYLQYLKDENIDCHCIEKSSEYCSGTALITVEKSGENTIVVVPGANNNLNKEYVAKYKSQLPNDCYLMIQLETPLDGVTKIIEYAKQINMTTVLDPSPACNLPDYFYKYIDYLTPNETETATLTGISPDSFDQAEKAALILLEKGVKNIIIKAGLNGVYYFGNNGIKHHIKAFKVQVQNTTAAGDTFNAGFVYSLIKNKPIEEALLFANATAAIKIQSMGAQNGMPRGADKIYEFIRQYNA